MPQPRNKERATEVTRLLNAASGGDTPAADDLLPLVYDELRQLARSRMSRETPGQTLQPTALVHEAYLRLVGNGDVHWNSRGHFFGAAARAMRRILVDRARRKQAAKRGGGQDRLPLESIDAVVTEPAPATMLALDAALRKLEERDPRKSRIVMLRYFAGLTIDQTARALSLAPTTIKDEWRFARAWLCSQMTGGEG